MKRNTGTKEQKNTTDKRFFS